jgi:hypothetical protein
MQSGLADEAVVAFRDVRRYYCRKLPPAREYPLLTGGLLISTNLDAWVNLIGAPCGR